jgi:hypothetical protein
MIDTLQPVAAPRIVHFADGGTARLVGGVLIAVIIVLFAYLPLVLVLALMGLGRFEDTPAGFDLFGVAWWAVCISWPVWICARHTLRTTVTLDTSSGVVDIVTTNYFLFSRTRRVLTTDIVDAQLMTPNWTTRRLKPLPLPVLILRSGEHIPLATQIYETVSSRVDERRVRQFEQTASDVRALLRRSTPATA